MSNWCCSVVLVCWITTSLETERNPRNWEHIFYAWSYEPYTLWSNFLFLETGLLVWAPFITTNSHNTKFICFLSLSSLAINQKPSTTQLWQTPSSTKHNQCFPRSFQEHAALIKLLLLNAGSTGSFSSQDTFNHTQHQPAHAACSFQATTQQKQSSLFFTSNSQLVAEVHQNVGTMLQIENEHRHDYSSAFRNDVTFFNSAYKPLFLAALIPW